MKRKIAGIFGLSVLFIFLMIKVVAFVGQESQLGADLADVQARLAKAEADEAALKSETQYLADPANLEKELRARFNYKKPGEKMIIIVPPPASSTATSTQ